MTADPKRIMRCFEDLKSLRLARESEWQLIADYFAPRKTFTCQPIPGELIRRRVANSIGPKVLARGAALLSAYLVDPVQPFVGPNLEGGLVRQGRTLKLSAPSLDYISNVQWQVHGNMIRAKSNYLGSTAQVCVELEAFGTGIRWIGRKRGFGPKYLHRPLRSCWIAENEDQEVDTVYFQFSLPVWRACERYPELLKHDKISERAGDDKRCHEPLQLLHVVQPRLYGRVGAVATAKPFESVVMAIEEQHIAEESGYDSFPYSVARLGREDGSVYGTGMAWQALPDVMVCNALNQGIELATYLRLYPPTMEPARLFARALDRRPGARNTYDGLALGFQSVKDAIQKLEIAGDPFIGEARADKLERRVEEIFFIDWMNLSDGVQKTAEEIRDRRDLRLRAMSSLVPSVDRDLIAHDADRTLEILAEEGLIGAPPAEIAGAEVEWDYMGPLAQLARRGQLEMVDRYFDLGLKAKNLSEGDAMTIHVEECLRHASEAIGLPVEANRSRADMEDYRAAANDRAEAEADLAEAQAAATTLRDAGQGISSLQGINGGGRPVKAAA